jgi:Golgi nucleoside diphosphatase
MSKHFSNFYDIIDNYDGDEKTVQNKVLQLYENESKTTFQNDLQKLFQKYKKELMRLVDFCSGCGKRGQNHVDKCYEKLILLNKINDTHFSSTLELPIKPSISDDGFGGLLTGLSMIAKYR